MFLKSTLLALLTVLANCSFCTGFLHHGKISKYTSIRTMKMMLDPIVTTEILHHSHDQLANWAHMVQSGLADATTATQDAAPVVCPNFGQPGWAPFCFLNGNPVFKSFDGFQLFIQNSVIGLHDFLAARGVKEAYGPSIILFTVFIRTILFPLNYQQLASSQAITALNPKVQEIREKYADNKELQAQMTALLYQEAKANPLSGCLPSLIQIPVFLALYRSFFNLAADQKLNEGFLWLPSLEGPVFGTRSTDWLFGHWENNIPSLGWSDTLAYLTIPVLLYIAQSISLTLLSPPSEDPAVQRTQQILKYLPLLLAYFSLSVPSGLGVYWVTNNLLSTLTTLSIKEYFKKNPITAPEIDLEQTMKTLVNSPYYYPDWGYTTEEDMLAEARANYRPPRTGYIADNFQAAE